MYKICDSRVEAHQARNARSESAVSILHTREFSRSGFEASMRVSTSRVTTEPTSGVGKNAKKTKRKFEFVHNAGIRKPAAIQTATNLVSALDLPDNLRNFRIAKMTCPPDENDVDR